MSAADRYELGPVLGEGAFGRTYRATERASGRTVALKELTLRGLPDWKPVELLEREARVLRAIDHPGVPGFVEAFEDDEGGELRLYVVTELVEGDALGAKIRRGDRWDATSARRLLEDLLDTLAYLHGLSPPVIHRDVKPDNVIMRPDGRAVLVDFGAVRDLAAGPASGQTVLGTPGYMAPEQALGQSDVRSDLYGAGATVIHALTHVHPTELPRDGIRLQFANLLGVTGRLVEVLQRLVEPDPGARFAGARQALEALRGEAPVPARETALATLDENSALAVPDAPRELPPALLQQTRGVGGMRRLQPKHAATVGIGAAVTVMGMVGAASVVPAIAAFMPLVPLLFIGSLFAYGFRRAARDRWLMKNGAVTDGRVTGMRQPHGQGRIHISYAFGLNGQELTGILVSDNLIATNNLGRGDPVAVFYDPERPTDNVAVLPEDLQG